MNPPIRIVVLALLMTTVSTPAWATIQSEAASRQFESSLAASVEVPVAVAHALSEGVALVVTAVDTSAEGVAITVAATAVGASFVVSLSAQAAEEIGVVAGTTISVTVVATGWLLSAAGEVLCFIANEVVRPHIHTRRIH